MSCFFHCYFQVYPMLENGKPAILPPNSFFTCSSDDTIRIWNLDPHMPETASYKTNIYSHVCIVLGLLFQNHLDTFRLVYVMVMQPVLIEQGLKITNQYIYRYFHNGYHKNKVDKQLLPVFSL